jgi:hypothetical protein
MLLALAASACTAQVEGDEDIAQRSEALNRAADFQLGIVGVRYDSAGHAFKSTEAWTGPISLLGGLSSAVSDSPFTSQLVNPTGFRVGIKSLGTAPSILQFVDFRLRIQAKDSVNGFVGPVATTGWASQRVGIETYANKSLEMYYKAGYDQFKIGIEVRWWPAPASTTDLHDFYISAIACGIGLAGCGDDPPHQDTSWLSELAPGEVSWSHTMGAPDGGPITDVVLGAMLQ